MKENIITKYPKLIILVLVIIASYIIFQIPYVANFISNIDGLGYAGIFIAGMMYSFGFVSPLSAGFFLALHAENILFSGIIGGIGAMIADLFVFSFVKVSFADEFHKLRNGKASMKLKSIARKFIGKKARRILLYIFAGILIASPLPDESGIIIIAGLTKMKERVLAGLSFILNTIGIIALLYLGNLI